jgi:tRNA1(Val) A37 N6-methylase TrmN6
MHPPGTDSPPDHTDDALLGGRIRYRQPARGYRVGLEAPLLAAFALVRGRRPPKRAVDLGAGPGAVGLCLAHSLSSVRVTLVEPEPFHAALARENVASNGLAGRVEVLEQEASGVDLLLGRGAADLVVSNPPWFDEGAGARATGEAREGARRLDAGELDSFVSAARQLLGYRGRLCVAFPAAGLVPLLQLLAGRGLHPKRLKALHPRLDAPATAVFVEAVAGKPGGLQIEAPWAVRGPGEAYTDEMRRLLWGGATGPGGSAGGGSAGPGEGGAEGG